MEDLQAFKNSLVDVVEEFYRNVFQVKLRPKIEMINIPKNYAYYDDKSNTICIPSHYYKKLEEYLRNKDLDKIVDFLSVVFHETVHYSLNSNEGDMEKYGIFTVEGPAEVLYLFYLNLGVGIELGGESSLEEVLYSINRNVIKGFLDKKKLKETEEKIMKSIDHYIKSEIDNIRILFGSLSGEELLRTLNEIYYRSGPFLIYFKGILNDVPAYFIIREVGINEYVKDLREVILSPKKKWEIMEKYSEIIRKGYERILLSSSAVSSGGFDTTNSP